MATKTLTLESLAWVKIAGVSDGQVLIISHIAGRPVFVKSALSANDPPITDVGHRINEHQRLDLNTVFGPIEDESIYIRIAGRYKKTILTIETGER